MKRDNYLIRGGTIVDGSGDPSRVGDVRLRQNRIEEVGTNLPADQSEVVDATGLLVTPGLIDLHTHCYHGTGIWSVDPAEIGLRTGVTTMLDTGSAGCLSYGTFHLYVIPTAREDIYALLNISQLGVQGHKDHDPTVYDLSERRHIHPGNAIECIERYPDRILGTKARLTLEFADNNVEHEYAAMHGAIEAARKTGRICMFHHVASGIPLHEVLEVMNPGDILTHIYHGKGDGGFESKGCEPAEAMRRARDRGIVMDVGHGIGSFTWRVAEPACQQHGFWPDTISTDAHQFNLNTVVYDMPTTMTKFLYLGMSLEQVVRRSSWEPAKAMGLSDRLGLLKPGFEADVALLRLEQGRHELTDVKGAVRHADQKLVPFMTFKRGECFRPTDSD